MEQRETIGAAPKISILMPSKNVRPYIEECMESVLHQTLRDIEIFCVDADSTDGTLACLERYAAADRRVHILHDDRGSTGYANNLAIRQATGKYIGLVETDDYVEPEMFERLYEAAETAQADVCRMDFARFWGDGAERETLVKQIAARARSRPSSRMTRSSGRAFTAARFCWRTTFGITRRRGQRIRIRASGFRHSLLPTSSFICQASAIITAWTILRLPCTIPRRHLRFVTSLRSCASNWRSAICSRRML